MPNFMERLNILSCRRDRFLSIPTCLFTVRIQTNRHVGDVDSRSAMRLSTYVAWENRTANIYAAGKISVGTGAISNGLRQSRPSSTVTGQRMVFAERPRARIYSNRKEILAREELDIISVATYEIRNRIIWKVAY